MKTRIEEIGPEQARAFLTKDAKAREITKNRQRPVNNGHVKKLATQMSAELWRPTHQGVAITDAGEVVDGQHRLHAVIQSGMSVKLMVTYGVPADVFVVLDTGRKRTPSDILGMAGFVNTNQLAACLRTLRTFDLFRDSKYWHGGEVVATNEQVLEYAYNYPNAIEWVNLGRTVSKALGVQTAAVSGAFLIIDQYAPSYLVKEFADSLKDGTNLAAGDPVLVCRNWLIHVKDRATTKRQMSGYALREMVAIIIKAWNLHAQGMSCSQLRFSDKEAFPLPREVKGLDGRK